MASGNIYGIKPHQNKRQWRLYPVEGPDFVVLNMKEYEELQKLFINETTKEELLLTEEDSVDIRKIVDLFDKTPEDAK